eukprot:UN27046
MYQRQSSYFLYLVLHIFLFFSIIQSGVRTHLMNRGYSYHIINFALRLFHHILYFCGIFFISIRSKIFSCFPPSFLSLRRFR